MIITLANSDEQWKWSKYAVALPLSKKQIVTSDMPLQELVLSLDCALRL